MRRLLPALLSLALLLAGCGRHPAEDAPDITLYYIAADLADTAGGDAIRAVPASIEGLEELETWEAAALLLSRLAESGDGWVSPLPAGVTVEDIALQGRRVYVDFSRGYGSLTGIRLSLADYCVALSLCQLEEVSSVYITAAGQPLSLRGSQVLMEQDVVLSGMEDIVRTVAVSLWFLDGGGALVQEQRELELYEGQTLAEALAAALEEGPQDRGRSAVLPAGFTIRSVRVEDGVCWLNILSDSMALLPEAAADQEIVLQAISRTFLALESVQELRLLVDGTETDFFGQVHMAPYSVLPAGPAVGLEDAGPSPYPS